MKKRIWELDAFRGLCILGMIAVHLVYDLVELYALVDWTYPPFFSLIKNWGGALFLLLSGICVTLGSHPVKRGLLVFGCGMLCTLATAGMYWLDYAGKDIVIYFGVLHCLGLCMVLWPLFKRLPAWTLAALGAGLAALGLWMGTVTVSTHLLVPLGLTYPGFGSSDYFPLLPNLGYFLVGAFLGKTLYRKQETLLPRINPENPLVRFLGWCGRMSLFIYLLHQPVLTGLMELYVLIFR